MPSTFDSLLRLELQAVGENASTWGTKANSNFELIAQAIAGHISVNVGGGAAYSLLTAQASTDEVRQMFITFNGVLTSSIPVYIPASPGSWYVRDNTSGAFSLTLKTSAGTGVSLSRTNLNVMACDGVSVYPADAPSRVARTGDTMTGPLGLPTSATPDDANATRADYVRAQVSVVQVSVSLAVVNIAAVSVLCSVNTAAIAAVSALTSVNAVAITSVSAQISVALVAVSAKVAKAGDTMTGVLYIVSGTAQDPGIGFSGDTNTGIYRVAADTLGITTNGTQHMRVDASGRFIYGGTSASVKPGYENPGDINLPEDGKIYGLNLPKAYARFNGVSGTSIIGSFGVAAISAMSAGVYRVTMSNNLANANYVVITTPAARNNYLTLSSEASAAPTVSTFTLWSQQNNGTYEDQTPLSFIVFGR